VQDTGAGSARCEARMTRQCAVLFSHVLSVADRMRVAGLRDTKRNNRRTEGRH